LFINPSGTPVARSQFTEALHGALSFVGLSPMKYKGHSFRIGAATWAMIFHLKGTTITKEFNKTIL
jgi:hypothetical protein